MNTVLVIDDEKAPMKYYIQALSQKGFEVKQCFDPEDALQYIKESSDRVSIIILDIMMPAGERYKNENTDDGLKTGLFLIGELQTLCRHIPVIVLTNVTDPGTLNEISEGPKLKVALKLNYPPLELAQLVCEFIKASGEGTMTSTGA